MIENLVRSYDGFIPYTFNLIMNTLLDIKVSLTKVNGNQSTGMHKESLCDMKCKYYSIWIDLFWFSVILYYGVYIYIEIMA